MDRAPSDTAAARERAALETALVATAGGDRAAFRDLYRRTSAKLFGIVLRICGESSAAEDVMSEAYLTIWKRAESYEPGRVSPITWLSTIARNKAIDWRRRASNRPAPRLDDIVEPTDRRPLADRTLERAEEDARLERCVEALGDPGARYVRTAFFGGLTYSQLAEREDIPLGTMKSRMRRALMALKTCMED
ncbi:sigma-70 family RNA polymerase sigma factor [Sphingomicrobium sp. XHP0235]|uniref:sigma-70 family RNA polymerase sigma factor n=1 Tax=Sphingomicrobium aquimarinum TaxID=3133971 RepID=UPI0031FEDBE3